MMLATTLQGFTIGLTMIIPIGAQNAFRLKNKAQVFAEVPLSLRGSWTIPSAADTKIC